MIVIQVTVTDQGQLLIGGPKDQPAQPAAVLAAVLSKAADLCRESAVQQAIAGIPTNGKRVLLADGSVPPPGG